jgi:4-amino-4-deoxy-L-arabinose transferase-like glycosyltransferase
MANASPRDLRRQRPIVHLALLALFLIAFILRTAPLTAHRFHADEALYASWALHTTSDPALISEPLDKPPLPIYTLASLFRLVGPSELVARLPNLAASMVSIGLLYAGGKAVYGMRTALSATVLYAVSPLASLFAPTAFMDPQLVMWMLFGLWAAVSHQPLVAGLSLGLAYATKQQSVLLMPLVLAALVWSRQSMTEGLRPGLLVSLIAVAGFLPIFGLVTWWDSLRWHLQPSFWDRSLITYGGLGLAPLSAWAERAVDWGKLLGYVFDSSALNCLLLLGLPVQLWTAGHECRRDAKLRFDLVLAVYLASYLVLHWVTTIQVWDRYLLPLVPLMCLLLARGLCRLRRLATRLPTTLQWAGKWPPIRAGSLVAAALILGAPALAAARSQVPVGSDHGAYQGIDRMATFVQANLPEEATLYYHWLGWHYRYYLHNAEFSTVWYPDPQSLAEEAAAKAGAVRTIAFPEWRDDGAVQGALAHQGLALVPLFSTYRADGSPSFALHLITEDPDRDPAGGET